jgi:hypothetical protein
MWTRSWGNTATPVGTSTRSSSRRRGVRRIV